MRLFPYGAWLLTKTREAGVGKDLRVRVSVAGALGELKVETKSGGNLPYPFLVSREPAA